MAITRQEWSISALAVELRRDKRTIATIIDEGGVQPCRKTKTKKWYRLAEVVGAMVGSEELDLQQEKAKLAVEQTRRIKLQNDIEEGNYASVDELSEALEGACKIISSHLEALPLTLKKRNPNLTGKDIEIIRKEIAKCRNAAGDAVVESAK